jgi:hypothetical protein
MRSCLGCGQKTAAAHWQSAEQKPWRKGPILSTLAAAGSHWLQRTVDAGQILNLSESVEPVAMPEAVATLRQPVTRALRCFLLVLKDTGSLSRNFEMICAISKFELSFASDAGCLRGAASLAVSEPNRRRSYEQPSSHSLRSIANPLPDEPQPFYPVVPRSPLP